MLMTCVVGWTPIRVRGIGRLPAEFGDGKLRQVVRNPAPARERSWSGRYPEVRGAAPHRAGATGARRASMDGRAPQGDEWSRVPSIRGRELGSVSDPTWRRSYVPADREMVRVPRTRPQFEARRRDARVVPAPPATGPLGRIVLLLSGALLILGVACGQWLLHPEYAAPIAPPRLMVSPPSADRIAAEPNVASKSNRLAASAVPAATVPPASAREPAAGRGVRPAAAIAR